MKLTDYLDADNLTATERRVIAVCRRINERPGPQQAQRAFHERISRHWIRWCVTNLLDVDGLEHVRALRPEAGVLLCANHRSFFDLYVVGTILSNFRNGGAAGQRIRVEFGPPVDLSDLRQERPRITLYKRASDRILEVIRGLGESERARSSARP